MDKFRKTLSLRKKKEKNQEEDPNNKPISWQEDERKVREGFCSFQVKYLGHIEVFDSRGMQVCEEAIKALRRPKKKAVRAILYVSGDTIRVSDEISKGLIVDQTIEKVSFCSPDRNHKKGFAYICRDGTTRRWMCHAFLAVKESGERLSHAVGCAFAICLEKKQKRESEVSAQVNTTTTSGDNKVTISKASSFRQTSLSERLQDPQSAIIVEPHVQSQPHPPAVNASSSPAHSKSAAAVPRPHASASFFSDRQTSLRMFPKLQESSPFKRELSLRLAELPTSPNKVSEELWSSSTSTSNITTSTHTITNSVASNEIPLNTNPDDKSSVTNTNKNWEWGSTPTTTVFSKSVCQSDASSINDSPLHPVPHAPPSAASTLRHQYNYQFPQNQQQMSSSLILTNHNRPNIHYPSLSSNGGHSSNNPFLIPNNTGLINYGASSGFNSQEAISKQDYPMETPFNTISSDVLQDTHNIFNTSISTMTSIDNNNNPTSQNIESTKSDRPVNGFGTSASNKPTEIMWNSAFVSNNKGRPETSSTNPWNTEMTNASVVMTAHNDSYEFGYHKTPNTMSNNSTPHKMSTGNSVVAVDPFDISWINTPGAINYNRNQSPLATVTLPNNTSNNSSNINNTCPSSTNSSASLLHTNNPFV